MGTLAIINGSPRANVSNSKKYIEIFQGYWKKEIILYQVIENHHDTILHDVKHCSDILLVFPLYVDGIPVVLMDFLKALEKRNHCINLHVLINCGFLEPHQNQLAVDMIKYYCKRNAISFGSTLCIGSGEAILNTPFQSLVKRKIRVLAKSIQNQTPTSLTVTMPLPRSMFIHGSTTYWVNYGKKNHITKEDMQTMKIEGK